MRIFAKALADATNQKTELFNKNVEAVRKSIERVFGVLYQRFTIMFIACEFWTVEKMKLVSEAAVVILNMIVEHWRAGCTSNGTAGRSAYIESDEALTDRVFTENCPEVTPLFSQSSVTVSDTSR